MFSGVERSTWTTHYIIWLYFLFVQVYTYKPSQACLFWIVHLIKLIVIATVLAIFVFCSYHVILKYSVIYCLFLCYPLVGIWSFHLF
jgi:hypothetical protein